MVTDSACSLPEGLAVRSGVTVVPMWVNAGGKTYRDGELPVDEVLARLGEDLSTSGPAPGEVADAAKGANDGEGVVVLTVSRRMSSSYDVALLASKVLEGEPMAGGSPPGESRVAVVDTGTAAGGQGLVVLAAARAAKAGKPLSGVVAAAERAAREVRLLAALPSLEHLARSGRVPGAAAWGARWLGLVPLFEFKGGRVWPQRPARGTRQAYGRVLDAFARDLARSAGVAATAREHVPGHVPPDHVPPGHVPPDHVLPNDVAVHVAALHAMDQAGAEGLLDQVRDRAESLGIPLSTAFVGSFSAVMVVHTGPGLAGLAWWVESGRTEGGWAEDA